VAPALTEGLPVAVLLPLLVEVRPDAGEQETRSSVARAIADTRAYDLDTDFSEWLVRVRFDLKLEAYQGSALRGTDAQRATRATA
jgi:hypothetical protein